MRAIGFRTNILFILASALGLLAALGRPWYAAAPAPLVEESGIGTVPSPVEVFFSHLTREISTSGGTKGWDAFSSTDTILAVLALVAVVTALGALTPGIETPCREGLRLVTLAMLGIVVVKLVNTPDALAERRQGAWIALCVTGIMASSAATLYAAPVTRRKSGRSLNDYQPQLVAPPRSTAFDTPEPHVPPVDRY